MIRKTHSRDYFNWGFAIEVGLNSEYEGKWGFVAMDHGRGGYE